MRLEPIDYEARYQRVELCRLDWRRTLVSLVEAWDRFRFVERELAKLPVDEREQILSGRSMGELVGLHRILMHRLLEQRGVKP